jgi:hypothetical protein
MLEKERQRLSRPLTAAEREQALSALDASERLSDQLSTVVAGRPSPTRRGLSVTSERSGRATCHDLRGLERGRQIGVCRTLLPGGQSPLQGHDSKRRAGLLLQAALCPPDRRLLAIIPGPPC